mgnify:FL=1
MGRGLLLVLVFIIIFSIIVSGAIVLAQENDSSQDDIVNESDDVEEEFSDSELGSDGGMTPDSNFYFIDEFFDRFGDEVKVREEKIAEIREMIKEGKIEAARIALERYGEYADRLEKDSDPQKSEEIKRSAAAIKQAINELKDEISEEEEEEFVDVIIEKEKSIVTSSEIASKIKELCEKLSSLDPVEYSRTCKSGEDSLEWQRNLDRKLTKEQEKEAREFFNIMSRCFKNPSECRCGDIKITAFAEQCSVIAPLVVKCEEGDEDSCEKMEEAGDPIDLLPDYLQDVMRDVERKYGDNQFELHIPKECRKEGAKTPKDCMKIMFRLNAPEECVKALEEGRIDLSSEREARKDCEEIMFKENAPEECVEAGLKDPKECGKLMFKENAPEECIEAGLTGENRGDEKKCRLIMESKGRGPGGEGPPALGIRCKNIENSEERLKCYDSALEGAGREFEEREFKREEFKNEGEFRERGDQFRNGEFKAPECGENQHSECDQSGCRCVDGSRAPEGFNSEQQPPQPSEELQPPLTDQGTTQSPTIQEGTQISPESSQTITESQTSGETHTDSSESSGTSGTTGNVVFSDNEFFNYYYK